MRTSFTGRTQFTIDLASNCEVTYLNNLPPLATTKERDATYLDFSPLRNPVNGHGDMSHIWTYILHPRHQNPAMTKDRNVTYSDFCPLRPSPR